MKPGQRRAPTERDRQQRQTGADGIGDNQRQRRGRARLSDCQAGDGTENRPGARGPDEAQADASDQASSHSGPRQARADRRNAGGGTFPRDRQSGHEQGQPKEGDDDDGHIPQS